MSTFFSKQELLDVSKVSAQDLTRHQENGVMPKFSYKLNLKLQSDSFFGLHNDEQEIEYFAKGYSSWLAIVQSLSSTEAIYSVFANRYKVTIENLKEKGHSSNDPRVNSGIDKHIEEEWTHFLNGIYGLCTKSGLPEDIAAKEFSILEINELTKSTELTNEQIKSLTRAVNLLDLSSSLFAPHERLESSRQRLINEVRRKYELKS